MSALKESSPTIRPIRPEKVMAVALKAGTVIVTLSEGCHLPLVSINHLKHWLMVLPGKYVMCKQNRQWRKINCVTRKSYVFMSTPRGAQQ